VFDGRVAGGSKKWLIGIGEGDELAPLDRDPYWNSLWGTEIVELKYLQIASRFNLTEATH
jgi:hypothetical protein